MYKIVELNENDEIVGLINFDKLSAITPLETYWNIQLQDNINIVNVNYQDTQKIYEDLVKKFPTRIFEIRSLFTR